MTETELRQKVVDTASVWIGTQSILKVPAHRKMGN